MEQSCHCEEDNLCKRRHKQKVLKIVQEWVFGIFVKLNERLSKTFIFGIVVVNRKVRFKTILIKKIRPSRFVIVN